VVGGATPSSAILGPAIGYERNLLHQSRKNTAISSSVTLYMYNVNHKPLHKQREARLRWVAIYRIALPLCLSERRIWGHP
jgi:hypothetical protein